MENIIEHFDNKKWEEEISEFAFLHNDDCCIHFPEDSRACDVGIKTLDCCVNMRTIKVFIQKTINDRDKYWVEMIKHRRKHAKSDENKALTKVKKDINL